jgi:hypothetical protein
MGYIKQRQNYRCAMGTTTILIRLFITFDDSLREFQMHNIPEDPRNDYVGMIFTNPRGIGTIFRGNVGFKIPRNTAHEAQACEDKMGAYTSSPSIGRASASVPAVETVGCHEWAH